VTVADLSCFMGLAWPEIKEKHVINTIIGYLRWSVFRRSPSSYWIRVTWLNYPKAKQQLQHITY